MVPSLQKNDDALPQTTCSLQSAAMMIGARSRFQLVLQLHRGGSMVADITRSSLFYKGGGSAYRRWVTSILWQHGYDLLYARLRIDVHRAGPPRSGELQARVSSGSPCCACPGCRQINGTRSCPGAACTGVVVGSTLLLHLPSVFIHPIQAGAAPVWSSIFIAPAADL